QASVREGAAAQVAQLGDHRRFQRPDHEDAAEEARRPAAQLPRDLDGVQDDSRLQGPGLGEEQQAELDASDLGCRVGFATLAGEKWAKGGREGRVRPRVLWRRRQEGAMPPRNRLAFEKPIYDLEDKIAELEANLNGQLGTTPDSVRKMRRELANV